MPGDADDANSNQFSKQESHIFALLSKLTQQLEMEEEHTIGDVQNLTQML